MDRLTNAVEWVKRKWPRPEGLAVAIVLCSGGMLALLPAFQIEGPWALVAMLVVWTSLGLLWLLSRRVKPTRRGKVGFVVAISQEANTSPSIKSDFNLALKRELDASPAARAFQLIIVPDHVSEKIDDVDDVRALRKRLRAHFVLSGRVRRRKLRGGIDHEIVDLNGLVSHAPLSDERTQRLGREFSELLPRRTQIRSIDSFPGIEFTATWAGLIAKYIIGMAAGLSGDLDYAEKLFTEVQTRLKNENQGFLFYEILKQRIPQNLAEIAEAKAIVRMRAWFESKSEEHLVLLENQLADAKARGLTGNGLYISEAIVAFYRNRNTKSSRQYLSKIPRKARDAVWHLNLAFLEAYDGDLNSAARHYRSAVNAGLPAADVDITTGQIEPWLLWQLDLEPDRIELYFCLGYTNWQLKGDRIQARKDFQTFLTRCPSDKHPDEQRLVREWIQDMSESE